MAFINIAEEQKKYKVSETRARQDVVDKLGSGAGYWLEDILKAIRGKATSKSEATGLLGKIFPKVPTPIKRMGASLF